MVAMMMCMWRWWCDDDDGFDYFCDALLGKKCITKMREYTDVMMIMCVWWRWCDDDDVFLMMHCLGRNASWQKLKRQSPQNVGSVKNLNLWFKGGITELTHWWSSAAASKIRFHSAHITVVWAFRFSGRSSFTWSTKSSPRDTSWNFRPSFSTYPILTVGIVVAGWPNIHLRLRT